MKRTIIIASLCVLGLTLAGYGNEANNPSMEGNFIYQDPLGDVAEYWTGWRGAYSYLHGYFSEETSYAHDANKSQEVSWNGFGPEEFGPDGIYQQISSLQAGQSYRAAVWFNCDFYYYGDYGYCDIICSVGIDPNGGTNPDAVTDWADRYWDWGSWFCVPTFFSPTGSAATIFIKVTGFGDAWWEDWQCPEPPCMYPADWDAYCYIDDVVVDPFEVGQASTVTATTPVPADGANYSHVTITVADSNGDPVMGVPASEIDVNCTGSGNTIIAPEQATDENGQTTAKIKSTVAETKTVRATVLGTALTNTAIVEFTEPIWLMKRKLTAGDGANSDYFGRSVSVSGEYAIVGADGDDDNGYSSGSAYIFKRSGESWSQTAKLLASDGAAYDCFGRSVSVSGEYAIVGAYGDDANGADSGSAYTFKRNGESWTQQCKLIPSDGAASDYFGWSVSIGGEYAIVGAYQDDDNGSSSGSAYIFKRSDDPNDPNWYQQTKLIASDGAASDYFGRSVSISGEYAIVGAYQDDDNGYNSGSAYIFTPNDVDPNTWDQQAKLLASDGAGSDCFGISVSINGDYAIVGAYQDDDNGGNSGSAYMFKRSGENWTQQCKLTASDGTAYDYFGYSVSIAGEYAIVGAHQDDDNGSNSGSAYIFTPNDVYLNTWDQEAKLLPPDGAASDYFGISVSIDGRCAFVGAHGDDDNGSGSGSAYVFARGPGISPGWTAEIADSAAEFSDTQGQDNWYYGYYDGDSAFPYNNNPLGDDFELMTQFIDRWFVQEGEGGFWTSIGEAYIHPNGEITSGGRQPVEHWAVRRWVSEVNGVVNITGHLADADPGYGSDDGIAGHIIIDGNNVFAQVIEEGDTTGVDFSLDATVTIGSLVDFCVAPRATDGTDSTELTVVIGYYPGDMDGDGDIDWNDLRILVEQWLDRCRINRWCGGRDIDEDGNVDFDDFAILAANLLHLGSD